MTGSSCVGWFLIFLIAAFQASAQYTFYQDDEPEIGTVGIGLGQNFGGIGLNGTYYFKPNLGGFVGVGYALAGTGVNAGVKARMLPEKINARPYFIGMVGYNAAVAVVDKTDLNKLFYGVSFGGGIDFYKPSKEAYWSLGLVLPLRSPRVETYMRELEDKHGITFTKLMPITFSIGYHFMIE